MKKQLLILLFFVAIVAPVFAQVIFRTYVEKTQISPKVGVSIGFENQFQWEYGAFFQETSLMESLMMSEVDKEALPQYYEKRFVGLYVAVPIVFRKSYVVKANIRTGVTNGENFIITPSVLADYKLARHIRVGVGMGLRNLRPTLQSSVAFSF